MEKIDFDKFVEGMRKTCRPDTHEELLGEFLVAKQVLSNVLLMLDVKKSKAAEEGDDEGVKMALEGAKYVMGVMCLLGEDIEKFKAEWLGKEAEEKKDGTGNKEAPKTHWELQGHGVTVVRDEES